eukprot:TRINITY_DN48717_c0_g1_i2.p1 TRINITY_DN48717_c0_g1~~TRINITY_DN48717_c0_g1_i2.p1  ORF type:complete len:396 (+),score=91.63 TRINITY_DN48717_c0_g1_i2:48-1190(+)
MRRTALLPSVIVSLCVVCVLRRLLMLRRFGRHMALRGGGGYDGRAALALSGGLSGKSASAAPPTASRLLSTSACFAGPLTPPVREGMGSAAAEKALGAAGLEVELVPCLSDNYCPILHHKASGATAVVDTPDGAAILDALKRKGWKPTHILNTHHHDDHVGGNMEIKAAFPEVRIVGPKERVFNYPGPYPPPGQQEEVIPGIDTVVAESDLVDFGPFKAKVFEVPGHTDGHVAYYFAEVPLLFSGDTLFTMGCGRAFTGDFARMQKSLQKLREAIAEDAVVYSAHEYTASNAKFAQLVEPENEALSERIAHMTQMREDGLPTVPTLMAHERLTNPFLRWDVPAVMQQAAGLKEPESVFAFVRRWKDTGKKPDPSEVRSKM